MGKWDVDEREKFGVKINAADPKAEYLADKLGGSFSTDANNNIELDGDSASPGNDKYYGTDSGGTKGFHSITVDPDEKVKATSGDTAGYLDAKVDDSTIEVSSNKMQVKNSGITAGKLATNSVTTEKLDTDSVTAEKLEDDLVFDQFPSTPSAAPDADYEVANKKYVDDQGVSSCFGSTKTSDQTVSDSVWTKCTFSEDFDINDDFSSSRFVAPETGYYFFTGSIEFSGTTADGFRLSFYKNGTHYPIAQKQGNQVQEYENANNALTGSILFYLTSGQYVELWGYYDKYGAGTPVFEGSNKGTTFSGFRIK